MLPAILPSRHPCARPSLDVHKATPRVLLTIDETKQKKKPRLVIVSSDETILERRKASKSASEESHRRKQDPGDRAALLSIEKSTNRKSSPQLETKIHVSRNQESKMKRNSKKSDENTLDNPTPGRIAETRFNWSTCPPLQLTSFCFRKTKKTKLVCPTSTNQEIETIRHRLENRHP